MNDRAETRFDRWLATLALTCLVAGCSTETTTERPASGPQSAPSATGADVPLELLAVDRETYEGIIARHRGSVILVDFWATWCLPCLQQFPHTVALASKYADRGLVVITVSLDDPGDAERLKEFLRSRRAAGLTNLISQFGVGTRSVDAFDIPGGALPHYKIYDRSGRLDTAFALDPSAERQFTSDDIDAAVQELLGLDDESPQIDEREDPRLGETRLPRNVMAAKKE